MKDTGFETLVGGKTQSFFELYNKHFDKIQFNKMHPEAYKPVYYFLESRGKRIRPLLLMLACDAFNQKVEKALNPAFGIELFHNFTLIHDDIMDKASIRRGRPTLHHKFTEESAILAGDFLLILAYRYLSRVDPINLPSVIDTFNRAATQIIEGQVMDSSFEKRQFVREDEYLKMIEYKTSVLLATSLKIGAIIGGASKEDQENIYSFGTNLGLAFQLKDDWLDVYGDQNLGKRIGGDILRNKKTYLFIKAYSMSSDEKKSHLTSLVGSEDEEFKISETIKIYTQIGAGEETQQFMNVLYDKSLKSLDKVSISSDKKADLQYFADRVYHREY